MIIISLKCLLLIHNYDYLHIIYLLLNICFIHLISLTNKTKQKIIFPFYPSFITSTLLNQNISLIIIITNYPLLIQTPHSTQFKNNQNNVKIIVKLNKIIFFIHH